MSYCWPPYRRGGSGGGVDFRRTDLKTMYDDLSSAAAGTTARLVNKSTGAYIYQAMSLGSGVVVPMADYADASGQVSEGGVIVPRIDWSAATPHQYGHVDTGATGTSVALTSGHGITATSGTVSVWDASAGVWLVQGDAFTRTGDTLAITTSITTQAGDLVYVDGVSEFDTDVWTPGVAQADVSGNHMIARIAPDGVRVRNAICARVRYLFSPISGLDSLHRVFLVRGKTDSSSSASGPQEVVYTGLYDEGNDVFSAGGYVGGSFNRPYCVHANDDFSTSEGASGSGRMSDGSMFTAYMYLYYAANPPAARFVVGCQPDPDEQATPLAQPYAGKAASSIELETLDSVVFGAHSVDSNGLSNAMFEYTELSL